jgi:hypothetical protein
MHLSPLLTVVADLSCNVLQRSIFPVGWQRLTDNLPTVPGQFQLIVACVCMLMSLTDSYSFTLDMPLCDVTTTQAGQFNNAPGAVECQTCPTGIGYPCPLMSPTILTAATTDVLYGDMIPSQIVQDEEDATDEVGAPSTFTGHAASVDRASWILSLLCLIFILILLGVYAVPFFVISCAQTLWTPLQRVDWLFTRVHFNTLRQTKDSPQLPGAVMFERRTVCGGLCTLVTLLLGLLLALLLLIHFGSDNVYETQSLVPSVFNSDISVTADMLLRVRSYQWSPTADNAIVCVKPGTTNVCASNILLGASMTDVTSASSSMQCATGMLDSTTVDGQAISYCEMSVTRQAAAMHVLNPQMLFSFTGDHAYALSVVWDLTFTSSKEGEVSGLSGRIVPPQGMVLKGLDSPSVVSVVLTPTTVSQERTQLDSCMARHCFSDASFSLSTCHALLSVSSGRRTGTPTPVAAVSSPPNGMTIPLLP